MRDRFFSLFFFNVVWVGVYVYVSIWWFDHYIYSASMNDFAQQGHIRDFDTTWFIFSLSLMTMMRVDPMRTIEKQK